MNPVVDPAREKVERADEALRDYQQSVVDDPTVFVKGAGLGALVLVELAKLAQAQSSEAAVRAYAGRIRRTQEDLRRELAEVAGRKGFDVPASIVHEDELMLGSAPEDPAALESWFYRQSRLEHFKATALFDSATRMKDADLAAFAQRMLPRLTADRDAAPY